MTFTFMKAYQNDYIYRQSFNDLAKRVFGIDFEKWFEMGYWNEHYVPYSFVDEGIVVSNVSVNQLDLIIHGVRKKAIQIGTVMTHPDYRGKGLSTMLMKKVLEEYESECDIIYLFANRNVLEYYPKFGFKPMSEQQYVIRNEHKSQTPGKLIKLDGKTQSDLAFIYDKASRRTSMSTYFNTANAMHILLFYCINVFFDNIYFIPDIDSILIFSKEGSQLHLYDCIWSSPIPLEEIVSYIHDEEIDEVVLHFTPDEVNKFPSSEFQGSEVMFYKSKEGLELPNSIKHPITSQA